MPGVVRNAYKCVPQFNLKAVPAMPGMLFLRPSALMAPAALLALAAVMATAGANPVAYPDQRIADVPKSEAGLPELMGAPDVLLRAATRQVIDSLKRGQDSAQGNGRSVTSPTRVAELVGPAILPLFNFRHMTQLALARNWRLVTPAQQDAIIVAFSTLLLRTFSRVLSTYSDQEIEYRPLRIAPGDTDVTVRSSVRQPGADRMAIDYDMEKTTLGWKVYDIKLAGISLITTYQSSFAQVIRDGGAEALIQSLSEKNRLADAGLSDGNAIMSQFLFMYAVIPGLSRDGR